MCSNNKSHEHVQLANWDVFHCRLSAEGSTPANVEYFAKKLTKPQLDLEGLATETTPLGQAVTLNLEKTRETCTTSLLCL